MVELPFFTRRTAHACESRDIRRRSVRVDILLREKCSVNAINAHCLDQVSNQFKCSSIFGEVSEHALRIAVNYMYMLLLSQGWASSALFPIFLFLYLYFLPGKKLRYR